MSPDLIAGVLSSTVLITVVTAIVQIVQRRLNQSDAAKERAASRKYADVDQVRAVIEEQNTALQTRVDELEVAQTARNLKEEEERLELKREILLARSEVAECRRQDAASRQDAALAKAAATTLKERVDESMALIAELKTTINQYLHQIQHLEGLLRVQGGEA